MKREIAKTIVVTSTAIIGISLVIFLIFFVHWSKFHYGDQQPKTIYVDSSKLKKTIPSISKNPQDTTKIKAREPQHKPVKKYHSLKPIIEKPVETPKYAKADTPKPAVTQTNKNGDNVAGNKSTHNFDGGTGNQYQAPIFNGDVTIKTDKQNVLLSNDYLQAISNYVTAAINKGFDSNNIVVYTESYATYPEMSQQIIERLKKNGYKASEGFATSAPVIDEIKIDTSLINSLNFRKKGDKKQIAIYNGKFKR